MVSLYLIDCGPKGNQHKALNENKFNTLELWIFYPQFFIQDVGDVEYCITLLNYHIELHEP